jgi:hypothetical protein
MGVLVHLRAAAIQQVIREGRADAICPYTRSRNRQPFTLNQTAGTGVRQQTPPVVKYGQEWHPPLPGGEALVHYIWRHRPADFEERYMARIDEPESLPWNLDQQVQTDYQWSREPCQENRDAEGKYLPPPMPEWRRGVGRREGAETDD